MNFHKLYQQLKNEIKRPVSEILSGPRLVEILVVILVLMIAGDTLNELVLAPFQDTLARTAIAFLLGLWVLSFVSRLGYRRPLGWVVIALAFFVGPVVRLLMVMFR